MKRLLFITEAFSAPFDEGIENIAFSLHTQLAPKAIFKTITKAENPTDDLSVTKTPMNKLFFNLSLRRFIREFSPDVILYLPEASITFNSFLRAKNLKLMNPSSKVALLGVKPVYTSWFQKNVIVNFLKPDLIFVLGNFDESYLRNREFEVKVLAPAVDNVQFRKVNETERQAIRAEYGISPDVRVILHVGHIRKTRNVESLLRIQNIEGVQVLIVGSTSTPVDERIKKKLIDNNIMVVDKYIADISKIYKMADIYVFPVFNKIASIHIPLSILEALACNLPVITTRFGGIVDYFKEDNGFRYFSSVEELIVLVKDLIKTDNMEVHNREKVKHFTWNRLADEIFDACNTLS